MAIRRNKCLLCQALLEPLDGGLQKHPETIDCEVDYTDPWGVAIDVELQDPDQPSPIDDSRTPPALTYRISHLSAGLCFRDARSSESGLTSVA